MISAKPSLLLALAFSASCCFASQPGAEYITALHQKLLGCGLASVYEGSPASANSPYSLSACLDQAKTEGRRLYVNEVRRNPSMASLLKHSFESWVAYIDHFSAPDREIYRRQYERSVSTLKRASPSYR